MALFISEDDVASLVSMSDAIETVREVFRMSGDEEVREGGACGRWDRL